MLYVYICNPFNLPLNKVFRLNTLRKGIISPHLSKYINKFISVDHCNLFISNRLKTFNIVYTMQNNILFNLMQLKFYTVSKKRLEFYCKCENKFGLYCFLSLYLFQRFTNNLQTIKTYIMNEQEKKFYNSKESMDFNKVKRQWQETGIRPQYYDDVMDKAIEKGKSLGLTKIWDLNI